MKLHRLTVRNFRAIDERTIEPIPTGVTVVEGPNETGKTSIIEALQLLLDPDIKANSGAARVKSIEPAGREAGSEVEADLEIGGHRLSYYKRYNRRPETTLSVHQPRAQQFSGDDAHEYFKDLFARHCDQGLWDMLRVQQAGGIDQPRLGAASALRSALEQVSGGESGGDDAALATLRASLEKERQRFYTPTFVPRDELKAARDEARRAEAEYEELRSRLAEAERLADDVARYQEDIARIEQRLAEARAELEGHREELDAIDAAERSLADADGALRVASLRREQARLRRDERQRLVETAERAAQELAELEEQKARIETQFEAIQQQQAELRKQRDEREEASAHARTTLQRAAEDREIVRLRAEVQNEEERLKRIAELQKQISEARRKLGAILVDRKALREITAAATNLEAARRQQQAGAASLCITAHQPLDLTGPDGPESISAGEAREFRATAELHLELGTLAAIDVTPPPSAAELAAGVRTAQNTYNETLRLYRVSTVDEAHDLLREREEAERIDRETPGEIQKILRDLEEVRVLREKYERESGRLQALLDTLPAGYTLPSGITEAEDRERTARTSLAEAEEALEPLKTRDEQLAKRLAEVDRKFAGVSAELDRVQRDAEASVRQLDQARAEQSDKALEEAIAAAEEEERQAAAARDAARAAFDTLNPERVRTLADNARELVKTHQDRLDKTRDELTRARSILDDRSAAGLFERAEDAATTREHANRRLDSIERQAAAARLLWETLEDARREAHRRYAGPLTQRIRDYGVLLFGDSFDVELDDDLTISRRSLDGITLDFDQLSGGAKEQLALLARLATATLVDPDAGVPLIIDDALGYTDPQRLRTMGAVLALAGKHCQVIVLTCYPGRYEHVGGAHFIRMP